MSQTPIVKAMLDWLASCPLVSSYNGGDVAFSIEYLGAEPAQFSLEVSPTAPILEQYISGSLRARNFVLASRMIYSQDEAQQAANSGFWEEFSDWVETQSRRGELPLLGRSFCSCPKSTTTSSLPSRPTAPLRPRKASGSSPPSA